MKLLSCPYVYFITTKGGQEQFSQSQFCRRIRIRVRVPRVAAATIRGQCLVKEIRYHHHYGVCKTFIVAAAAATVYHARASLLEN